MTEGRKESTVKWFDAKKGFGFINHPEGGDDLFVHYVAIQGDGYRTLKTGQRVSFRIEQKPKGLAAVDVRPVENGESRSKSEAPEFEAKQEDFKKVRLFKVQRELDVSANTILKFLEEAGFTNALSGKGLNTSITDEAAYLALLEKYAGDTAATTEEKNDHLSEEEFHLRPSEQQQLQFWAWDTINERYSKGDVVVGKVTSTLHFGAFVELEEGVEGLVHVSKMSNGYVKHPSQVVSLGQQVEATILSIDKERQRVELDMREVPAVDEPKASAALNGGEGDLPSDRELLLVDGLNVCYWAQGKGNASLDVLLTLLLEITGHGFDFLCLCDANAFSLLKRFAKEGEDDIFGKLEEKVSRIHVVTGGTRADDFLLQHADAEELRIITNDRYRNHGKDYSWLEKDESERLIKGDAILRNLVVPVLSIHTPIRTDTHVMAEELIRLFE